MGSLPQSITEDQLRQEFETYGEVEAIFIKDGQIKHCVRDDFLEGLTGTVNVELHDVASMNFLSLHFIKR